MGFWTKPKHIVNWAFASDDWEAPHAENAVCVGGKFKTAMAAKDKSTSFEFTGVYTSLKENELIEYDVDDGRHVKVEFVELSDSIMVTETFEPEKINQRDLQRSGWQAILDNFKKYAESLIINKNTIARVSTYLNFPRNTEEAFNFYKSIFGGDFVGGIHRFSEVPQQKGQLLMAEADKNLVMHTELPILAGHVLMGTDAPEFMGFKVNHGNNIYINLEPGTRGETDKLFKDLSEATKWRYLLQKCFWEITSVLASINLVCNGCLTVAVKIELCRR